MVLETTRTTTVLHVEDNPIGRYAVSRILRREGFEVVEAANGAEALRLARENPDLILLDVNMPDMDGFEVCRRLKADPATRMIPVLHLSATYTSSEDHVAGLERGADGFLTEPVDPPLLTATIRALVRTSRTEASVRDTARQWQATFDALRDGVCLLDAAGRLQRCNTAMTGILGKTEEEILGQRLAGLLPGLQSLLGDHLPGAALEQDHPTNAELVIGDRRFTVRIDPVLTEGGEVSGTVLVFAEVHEHQPA